MSDMDGQLARILHEADDTLDRVEIIRQLKEQAKDGDTDSIKLLAELTQYAQERKLRKDLFGV